MVTTETATVEGGTSVVVNGVRIDLPIDMAVDVEVSCEDVESAVPTVTILRVFL